MEHVPLAQCGDCSWFSTGLWLVPDGLERISAEAQEHADQTGHFPDVIQRKTIVPASLLARAIGTVY